MKKLLPPEGAWFYSAPDPEPELFVGGKKYFDDLSARMREARSSILICGWSLNLKTVMDDHGSTLEDVLFSLPESVQVKILIWDYIIFYVADRDPFLPLRHALKNKKNIEFLRFDFHPIMSSMHSKLVIVDERTMYLGGIDLDLQRRDGEFNLTKDSARIDANGNDYPPFRDYVLKFEGSCAKRFSEVFFQLWRSQENERSELTPLEWKRSEDDRIFFSRTVPKFKNNPQDYSSLEMSLWLIATARKHIYIENQYLTCDRILERLIGRLKESDPPEIVIVVSFGKMPFLEKISMGALLEESARKLLKADKQNRLRLYALSSGRAGPYVKVHSKCMVVDDMFLKVGSSNINNRSMRFDYELDALIKGRKAREYKEEILHTLLTDGGEFELKDSLIETCESANQKYGKLVELKDLLSAELKLFADYKEYLPLDKKQMTFFERMGQTFIGKTMLKKMNAQLIGAGILLALILAGALLFEPNEAKESLDGLFGRLNLGRGLGLMAVFYFGYLALGSFFLPLNAYIFLCGAYFPTKEAFALAMVGALSSASLSYWVGALFKSEVQADSKIEKIEQLKKLLKRNSLKTLIFLRMLPVAPFPLVNLICGKFGVGFGRYLLGTLIGIAPGSYALIFMEKRLIDLVKSPSWGNLAIVALLLALGAVAARLVKKRLSA